MFYVNNKQVLGMFLNGKNYDYLAYGFGKIIPEDRSVEQLNLNLADKRLNRYKIEFGTVKDGYNNALVSPRFDKPDSNGVFHTPFTYYYNGNIISTKEVPVLITNGKYALRNALVYNDMNINGAINYFATNTDFQGHNVNVFPEKDNYHPLLNYEMLNNCSNFDLNIRTRFSKSIYPTLFNCKKFSGNFRYVGNQDNKYPGFRGFLKECKDGVFNIDCTNMHGGGSDANVKNYFNFSCISNCNNIRLNITGSYWQAWVHPNCHSSNCSITTRNILPGFDRMNDCNFNIYYPSNTNVETSTGYSLLSNSYNCNITGNVKSSSSAQGLLEHCDGINVNLNCAGSTAVKPLAVCSNVNGNIVAGNFAIIEHCNRIRLFNVNNGNITFNNIEYGSFPKVYNSMVTFINVNNSNATCSSRGYVSALNNCHNLSLYGFNIAGEVLLENVYDSNLAFNSGVTRKFMTKRVNNCNITGFPYNFSYTENCRFEVGLEEAMSINNRYITWANVWPHGSRAYSGQYGYLAGLQSVDNSISRCSIASSDGMVFGGSKTFNNSNNMLTSLDTFYNGTVTANLPNYNMNIKLNVDCNTLNLGVFQAGPPHGFEYSSISADNIYCTTRKNYYVQVNYGTRIYCENFCNVAFRPVYRYFSDNYQPVLLINNYQHSNAEAHNFKGGIYRIGRLNCGSMSVHLGLYSGACMFINNTILSSAIVNNALLFLGSNARVQGVINVTNGGLIVNRANYSMSAIGKFVNRKNFTWNFTDSGPWGPQSLLDFCINV